MQVLRETFTGIYIIYETRISGCEISGLEYLILQGFFSIMELGFLFDNCGCFLGFTLFCILSDHLFLRIQSKHTFSIVLQLEVFHRKYARKKHSNFVRGILGAIREDISTLFLMRVTPQP